MDNNKTESDKVHASLRRVSLQVLVVVCSAILVFLAYFLWNTHRSVEREAEKTITNVVTALDAHVHSSLRRIEAALEEIAVALPADALDRGRAPRYQNSLDARLAASARHFPEISAYRVVDRRGEQLYRSDGATAPSFADRQWFKDLAAAPATRIYFSDVIQGMVSKRPLMIVAKPLTSPDGSFRGVVLAAFDLSYFQTVVRKIDVGPRGVIGIRRSDNGNLVLRQPETLARVNTSVQSPMQSRVQAGDTSGVFRFHSRGDQIERLFAFRRVPDYPFHVTAAVAADDYLAAWRNTAVLSGVAAFLLLLFVGFFTRQLWRSAGREAAARDSLAHSEERFRNFSESGSDWFWETGPGLRLTSIDENPVPPSRPEAMAELAGRTLPDILSSFRSAEASGPSRQAQQVAEGKPFRDFEFPVRGPDGTTSWFSLSGVPRFGVDGALLGYRGVGRDVTERHLLERELGAMFAASSIGVALTRNRTWLRCNPAMESLFGYSHGEIDGMPTREIFVSDDDYVRYGAEAYSLIGAGKAYQREHIVRRKDGTPFWVMVQARAIDLQNPAEGAIFTFLDVTARRRTEEEARTAKDVAERANAAKSMFLSSMSHELRTPLNSILGFAQLLEADHPPLPERARRAAAEISKGGWHLLRLIDDVLDLAKIESGQVALSLEPVAAAGILAECTAIASPLAAERGLHFSVDTASAQSLFAQADATRLKQALLNLLSNAVKYNRKDGRITLACSGENPARVRFSVRDTGLGLEAAQIAHLFEPFNRLGRERSEIQGTGIGLVIARRLVEQMHGQLTVESQPGKGSSFHIDLPATAQPATPTATARPAALDSTAQYGQRIVLYVDDNPSSIALMEGVLERRPQIRLVTAHDGNLGLQLARAHLPDLIILDINLPGLNGIELAQRLNSRSETAAIPRFALSANALRRDIDAALAAGFHQYLTKPLDVARFLATLDDTLAAAGARSTRRAD